MICGGTIDSGPAGSRNGIDAAIEQEAWQTSLKVLSSRSQVVSDTAAAKEMVPRGVVKQVVGYATFAANLATRQQTAGTTSELARPKRTNRTDPDKAK